MKNLQMRLAGIAMIVILFAACQKENEPLKSGADVQETSSLKSKKADQGFVHGLIVNIDGEAYYFAGPPDGMNGAKDVPGHYWVQTGPNKVIGKHYNTGPFGMSKWWSSDAEDGELLYIVKGIIDTWSIEKAIFYKSRGFVHRHEFISVATGEYHPEKVVWLKHTAVTRFTLDGGPGAPNPPYEHEVTPGVDLAFPNNGFMPYPED